MPPRSADEHPVLRCQFPSIEQADALRRRSVSPVIFSTTLHVPQPPAKLSADWARDIALQLDLQPGDVEALPWARARARWPEHKHCLQAVSVWLQTLGMGEALAEADIALMACRGARYHHDAVQYGGSAFCNLFLSEDQGLDLHFPATGQRIPLTRGSAVIFDTGQPHAVIQRSASGYDALHFASNPSCSQVFLTWELPIENVGVAKALQIAFDLNPNPDQGKSTGTASGQLWHHGEPVTVCPTSGQWRP